MIKIIIADDHQLLRDGIKSLLVLDNDIEVLGEAENGQGVIQLLEQGLIPDIVITDMNMPMMGGIELTETLKADYPVVKVIMLTMLEHEKFIIQAFKAGVNGYLIKNASVQEMLYAVKYVNANNRYISTELALYLLDRLLKAPLLQQNNDDIPDFAISEREVEVLELIAEGYTNQEIADKLFTSKRTVEGYRQTMLERTGMRNTLTLVKYAVLKGIIK